jgi:hypothetical protein
MPSPFNYTSVIPILATPFHDDESLGLESLARLIRFNAADPLHGNYTAPSATRRTSSRSSLPSRAGLEMLTQYVPLIAKV